MAKLTRVTGKVFGGSAPLNEIGVFGSAKAGSPTNSQDVATIQSLSAYANGWGSAVTTSRNFPPIEEVTGVLKTISYQNCYLLQEGVPEYDASTEYSSTSIVKVTNGTNLTFYRSLADNNIGNPLTDGTYWAQAILTGSRNLGEIVISTIPVSDSSVHLLDGTVLNGDGIYKDFVDYIVSIYNSSLNYFCSEAEWQTSVSTYGSCGKFVYTAASGDDPATVRLPKVSDIIQGTTQVSALGDLVEAGLPNITGNIYAQPASDGAFYNYGSTTVPNYPGTIGGKPVIGFDASRSNSIYGNSSTVQPQTIKALYYIVVATAQKTDIEVDIDNIVTDLANKADVDLENISPTQAAKDEIIGWSNTDYSAGVSLSSGGSAPSDGTIVVQSVHNGSVYRSVAINGVTVFYCGPSANTESSASYPVSKNDVITFNVNSVTFYPYKGA